MPQLTQLRAERQGATAFKNVVDWTGELRSATIVRANEIAAQAIDGEDEDEDEVEEEDDMDDDADDDED